MAAHSLTLLFSILFFLYQTRIVTYSSLPLVIPERPIITDYARQYPHGYGTTYDGRQAFIHNASDADQYPNGRYDYSGGVDDLYRTEDFVDECQDAYQRQYSRLEHSVDPGDVKYQGNYTDGVPEVDEYPEMSSGRSTEGYCSRSGEDVLGGSSDELDKRKHGIDSSAQEGLYPDLWTDQVQYSRDGLPEVDHPNARVNDLDGFADAGNLGPFKAYRDSPPPGYYDDPGLSRSVDVTDAYRHEGRARGQSGMEAYSDPRANEPYGFPEVARFRPDHRALRVRY